MMKELTMRIGTNVLVLLIGLMLIGAGAELGAWFFDARDEGLYSIVDALPLFLRVPLYILGLIATAVVSCGGLMVAILSFPTAWMDDGPVSDIFDEWEKERDRRERELRQQAAQHAGIDLRPDTMKVLDNYWEQEQQRAIEYDCDHDHGSEYHRKWRDDHGWKHD